MESYFPWDKLQPHQQHRSDIGVCVCGCVCPPWTRHSTPVTSAGPCQAEDCQIYSCRHLLCPRFQSTPANNPAYSSWQHLTFWIHWWHSLPLPLLLLLSQFSVLLSLCIFLFTSWNLSVHYCRSLKCSTSNTATVQTGIFHCLLHNANTHTQPHAHSKTEAIEWSSCQED